VALAIIHKSIVDYRKRTGDKKQIQHGIWAVIYCALVAPMWFIAHDWWYMASLMLLHFYIFGGAYSWIVNGNSPFYLSKTSSAITERLMVWLGFKSTETPYLISAVTGIYFLIKTISNG
jgi:hypothetical protein